MNYSDSDFIGTIAGPGVAPRPDRAAEQRALDARHEEAKSALAERAAAADAPVWAQEVREALQEARQWRKDARMHGLVIRRGDGSWAYYDALGGLHSLPASAGDWFVDGQTEA